MSSSVRPWRRLIGYIHLADAREEYHDPFLSALEAEAPVVEEADLCAAYVDLTGMERLYPQPSLLVQHVIGAVHKRLPPAVDVRIGLAPNKFVAEMAAYHGRGGAHPGFGHPGGAHPPFVVSAAEAKAFLAPLPVSSLPIGDAIKSRLAFLGLDSLDAVAKMHPHALEAQFGREGRLAWELANGCDERAVSPRRRFRPIVETLLFPAPVIEWPAFWVGVRQLLARLWKRRERQDKSVRQLRLVTEIEEERWERVVTLHEPVGDLERLEALLRRRLEGTQLPGAVASLTMALTSLGPTYAGQESLFPGSGLRLKKIREALAGIKAREGHTGLYRIAEVEKWSRIPERRYALISFDL